MTIFARVCSAFFFNGYDTYSQFSMFGKCWIKNRFLNCKTSQDLYIVNCQENQCFQDCKFWELSFCRVAHVTRTSQGSFREGGQMAMFTEPPVFWVVFRLTSPSLALGLGGFYCMSVGDTKWPKVIISTKCVDKGFPTYPHLPLLFLHHPMFTSDTAQRYFIKKRGK